MIDALAPALCLEEAEMSSMLATGYYDESGKFKDRNVICLGGVASYLQDFDNRLGAGGFIYEWGKLLRINGVNVLTAKEAFNYRRPFGKNCDAIGLRERIDALVPFIVSIRNNLQVVSGTAIHVPTFKTLPPHFHQMLGDDPIYVAFLRNILQALAFTSSGDRLSLTFDEDEETTLPFYGLYKQIKKKMRTARTRLIGISFGNDFYSYGLQAADLVSAIIRLEMDKKLNNTEYDYTPLFDELTRDIVPGEKLWHVGIAVGDESSLNRIAEELLDEWKKIKTEQDKIEHEEQRIRELRQHDDRTAKGFTQRDKSQAGRGKERKGKAEI